MKPLILASLLFVAATAGAQQTQRLTANKASEYGLQYVLPTTTMQVTLEARCVERTPGVYAQYAKTLLNEDPIMEASKEWSLVDAELQCGAQAETDERFLVQFKSGNTVMMQLSAEGFPLAVNTENGHDFVTRPKTTLEGKKAEPTILEGKTARQAVTPEMMRATTLSKKAQLAAARILEIRGIRSAILAGEADGMPQDGQAMRLVLDNLEAQESALTAMFLGTEKSYTTVRTFPVTIPDDNKSNLVVARLSPTQGLLDADDLSGNPIYISFYNARKAQLPVNEKGVEKTFPKGGLAYRIPGSIDVSLTYEGKNLLTEKDIPIAQLGVVFGLDPSIFSNKKAPAYAQFDPLTGSIVETGTVELTIAED